MLCGQAQRFFKSHSPSPYPTIFLFFSHLNDTISLHATDHNVQKSALQTQAKVQFIVSHRKLFLKRLKQQQQKPHHHHQQQKALAQKFHLNLDVKCFTSLNPLKFFWGKNDCIIMECCWFCLLCVSVCALCVHLMTDLSMHARRGSTPFST